VLGFFAFERIDLRSLTIGENMKIHVQNLGVLKQADFEVGDLTIICGKNNTGKTYATYALYGFLKIWKHLMHIGIGLPKIEELIEQNALKIDLDKIWKERKKIFDKVCKRYSSVLYKIFASEEKGAGLVLRSHSCRSPYIFVGIPELIPQAGLGITSKVENSLPSLS